jgi:lambda family phage tail tape measure protein
MSDIEVGKLKVTADTSGIDEMKEKLADLKEGVPSTGQVIDKLVESFKNIPGPVGIAAVGFTAFGAAVGEMVAHTLEANQHLLELSEATGISVEKLQPLVAGMEMAGVSSDKLGMAVGKLSQAVGQALSEPTGKAAAAFKQLGISQEELKSGDTEQIMKDAAAGFAKYGDSIAKTAAERELFGKQGPQIVAALNEEAENADKLAEIQRDYGTAITEADAKSSRYFTSTLSLGMTMFQGVAQSITKSLLPGLQELVNQFVDSGKQGGFMRDVLDGLSATISVVAKAIITLLVEPVRIVVLAFKEAGTAIGAFGAAAAAVAHGDLTGAKTIMTDLSTQLNQMEKDAAAAQARFEDKLWGNDELEEVVTTAQKIKPAFEDFNQSAQKVNDTIAKLRAEFEAQVSVQNAAAQGLLSYKAAQDEVALATLRTQLAQEGASKEQIASAVALKQATDASKQKTDQEVAGWNLINKLVEDNIALTTHQGQLEKELQAIASNPQMSESEKQVASAIARSNEAYREQAEVLKEVEQFKQAAAKSSQSEIAALTMSANELKLYNQQAQLTAQYQKDIVGKTPEQVQQLAKAYGDAYQQITLNNQALVQFQQSAQGAMAGASQATKNFSDSVLDANKNANQLTTSFENGMAEGVVNALNGGKDAMKQFALDMIKQVELMIVKWIELKAIETAASFMSSGGTIGTGSTSAMARGGALTYAASGIVTSATMVAPNVIAGEQGNSTGEAILPLVRTSDGSLGVNTNGGGGGGGSSIGNINHVYQINVNAQGNQNPQQLAQQIANQVKQASALADSRIANALRQGGMLNPNAVAAF